MLIGLFEDDLAIQEMLRLLLQGEGYDITLYTSVEECLAGLHVNEQQSDIVRPDLLMIDLHLAQSISGLDVIEQIRMAPSLEFFPIILMTASVMVDNQDLQRLHVTLLLKPFDIDDIIRIISELVQM
ncbi:MAG TPA: response regulator [Ktedonobacteraceae bacterium]